ncbi:terminase small subunit [Lactobacillus amylolyticus]|uniref:terminase small subunit n=1 Tax=Lactobacillus amylolyticus TaxID=83683 RepID=UPI00248FFC83|nr:terminase small subunit [Lactobacillus amylolyticus]
MKKLTKKQLKFCREYLKTFNAYQSALKAGYSKAYAKNASQQILENRGIKNYIQNRTEKAEKQADSEVDDVLENIHNIASGKPIKRKYVEINNLAKMALEEKIGKEKADSFLMRLKYEENKTIISPAPVKEQVAAAELWAKISGKLRNDSKNIEKEKVRKLEAEANLADWKYKQLIGKNEANDKTVLVDDIGDEKDGNNGN